MKGSFNKILSLLVVILIVISNLSSSFAYEAKITEDGFKYYIDSKNKAIITGYIGNESEIILPSKIEGYDVTDIASDSFSNNELITSITLPESFKKIPSYAFEDCKSLKSVKTLGYIRFIGFNAFENCTSLENVITMNNPIKISSNAFYNCINLEQIEIRGDLQDTEDVYITPSIEHSAFRECKSLKSIDLNNNITEIENDAFEGCTSLTNVELPESLVDLGSGVFKGCTSLSNIKIPNKVEELKSSTFENCTLLEEISIPRNVKSMGNAFKGCTNLKNIELEDGLQNLSSFMFEGCTNLKNIEIPGTVKEITTYAFCHSDIENVILNEGTEVIGYGAFSDTTTKSSQLRSINLPEGLITIEDKAFLGSNYLKDIDIPSTVTEIGFSAFKFCSSIKELKIPESVNVISYEAFKGCSSLESLTIGNGIKEIEMQAFANCSSLTDLIIPGNVESIGSGVFSNCKNLTNIEIKEGVKTVDGHAFSDCEKLVNVKLPDTLSSMGYGAFMNCKSLKSITMPDVITIEPYIFGGTYIKDIFAYKESAVYDYLKNEYKEKVKEIKILFSKKENEVNKGDKVELNILINSPDIDKNSLLWNSDNNDIVSVEKGVITANSVGEATITVSTPNKKATSKCNIIVKPELKQVKTLKISDKTTNNITLSWNKDKNVTGYKIYRYDSRTKKYKLIKTIDNNDILKYTDKSKNSSTLYKYKISTYRTIGNKTYESDLSNELIAVTKPKTPIVKILNKTTKNITLSWNKSYNVTGYKIYRYNAVTKIYKLIGISKGNDNRTYTDNNRNSGSVYSYKVRAYRTAYGVDYYSDYSQKVKVVTNFTK